MRCKEPKLAQHIHAVVARRTVVTDVTVVTVVTDIEKCMYGVILHLL